MSNDAANGKNSLVGEFLLALARAPESVQEEVLVYGIRKMTPYSKTLIEPYPMLSHMCEMIKGRGYGQQNDPG